jgi:hypothetical protein
LSKNHLWDHRDQKLVGILIVGIILASIPVAVFAQKTSVCSLTDSQTQKAIAAWAKIATFLTSEPRCVNCHGGVNPYIDGVGIDPDDPFKDAEAPVSRVDHGGGKQTHENTGIMDQGCKKCHRGMAPNGAWIEIGAKPVEAPDGAPLPNWTTAPTFLSFVDKDPTTLCRQIKKATGSADAFIGHLKNDNGQPNFAGTAFYGNRGLDQDSMDDEHLQVQPPSITHAALMKLGQDWIDAMGGKFQGDEGCGCEVRHSLWSGQIRYVKQISGDEGSNELQDWSGSSFDTVTITVSDGVGSTHGSTAQKSQTKSRVMVAAGNGQHTLRNEGSFNGETNGEGTSPITVDVEIDETRGAYWIRFGTPTGKDGKPLPRQGTATNQWTQCTNGNCKNGGQTTPFIPSIPSLSPLSGQFKDRNHVQASYFDRKEHLGYGKNAVMTEMMTVDLWRSGSSK